ncbi:MAG: hypothetical protein MUF64_10285 [Polyangiaceae bacterium]|nr:hypothetical protein [Polyangiaceae bacterium]
MGDIRVQLSEGSSVQQLKATVQVGKGFLFLSPQFLETPGFSWISRAFLPDAAPAPRVLSLLGAEAIQLLGASLLPATLPGVQLQSLTSDRALYREGRDTVRLLLLDLGAPRAEQVLEILHHGKPWGRTPLVLDDHGVALAELQDLPAGDFEVRLAGSTTEPCRFTVASYRLAPLVVSLVERRREGTSRLWVRLRLEAYGAPVEGPVWVEVQDRGARVGREKVEARAGFAELIVALPGEGPHTLNLQLVNDPSRTASVPLHGSRASEREATRFCSFGPELLGSLLPGATSRPIRGLHLEQGEPRPGPFVLEQLDTSPHLRATTAVDHACVVLLDPTFPRRRADAPDPATAPHPAHTDGAYARGEKLFHQGQFVEAKALFELTLSSQPVAHPNYAYYVACCHARLGAPALAIASLRLAIEHGWNDWRHLSSDTDLASLRGLPAFEALCTGGYRELSFSSIVPGQRIELPGFLPASLLAIGAFVAGSPWEGWALLLSPEQLRPRVVAPEIPSPGSQVRIDVTIDTSAPASVYLVVKDARLLTPDTPLHRLASSLKTCATGAGKHFGDAPTFKDLAALLPPPMPRPVPPQSFGGPIPRRAGGSPETFALGAAGGPPRIPSPMAPMMMMSPSAPAPPTGAPPGPPPAPARSGAGPGATQSAGPPPVVTEEPELLFAGLLPVRDGQASVTVELGPSDADYLVEAFVLSGLNWAWTEARFRAEKTPSVALEAAPFVTPGDAVLGRLVLRCASGRMRARLLRDRADVPLSLDGRPLAPGEEIRATGAELWFPLQPGYHEAIVEDLGTGAADWVARQIDAPGHFRQLRRAVRMLHQGEELALDPARGVQRLRVLPGLDRPFKALVDATSDYGHACCEQTAAKMLAAAGMYMFSGQDTARRARAEAILLAGVRRERSMWLRGRGFKMYPDSGDEPNAYWGPKAAMHLWYLATLRDSSPSKALLQGIDECLEMAADVTRASRLPWPPENPGSCEDAYRAVRFHTSPSVREQALGVVRMRSNHLLGTGIPGGAVAHRVELAYGAAALLRGKQPGDLPLALKLANQVTQALESSGRLYSTVDSAAAIALMAELTVAGVVSGSGWVEVDGERMGTSEAAQRKEDPRRVRALQGVAVIEETRLQEDRWDRPGASAALQVSLERGGRKAQRVAPGDELTLRAVLPQGYRDGDLLWVCLPDGLSRVQGGGQIKLFSVDFCGKSEVSVPLAATGVTLGQEGAPAPQRFAVCLRNMFEEERLASPGSLEILIEGPDPSTGLGRLLRGFSSWFRSLAPGAGPRWCCSPGCCSARRPTRSRAPG